MRAQSTSSTNTNSLEALTKSLGERIRLSSSFSRPVPQPSAAWWELRLAGAGLSGGACAEAVMQDEAAVRTRFPREGCAARSPTFRELGMMATFKHMVQQVSGSARIASHSVCLRLEVRITHHVPCGTH